MGTYTSAHWRKLPTDDGVSPKEVARWIEDIALVAVLVKDTPMPNVVREDVDDDKSHRRGARGTRRLPRLGNRIS